MGIEIRPVTQDELAVYTKAVAFGFHEPELSDDDLKRWMEQTELDRTVAAVEKGDIVGTAGAYGFEMTFPGPVSVGVAGVTAVTVRSTHRRKGLLTKMMRFQLDEIRDRGEAIAALTASESIIYPRFGYGWASSQSRMKIETAESAFRSPVVDSGRLRLVDKDAATKVVPDLHERSRRRTVGDISRSQVWWDQWFGDPKDERHGWSARFYLVHENAKGKADGYATYRLKQGWDDVSGKTEIQVNDVVADDPATYASIWRTMLDIDLCRSLEAGRPVDDPLRWLLADPRQLRTQATRDFLWIRLVDVAHGLAARRYNGPGTVVFEVADPFCPWNEGRYELTVDDDGMATCVTTKKKADLSLSAVELGSAYLGGVTFAVAGLRRSSRRTEGRRPRARRRPLPSTPTPPTAARASDGRTTVRQSHLLGRTRRDDPADAEAASHRLLVRAGYTRRLASGVWSYLPLGHRVLQRISAVVREEMDAAGAQELLLPILQPIDRWERSGRAAMLDDEFHAFQVEGRGGRFVLGPTHEEIVTEIVGGEIASVDDDLPVTVYQVQTKFRDEARPRFGLLRGREFVMKDAYSFDVDPDGLQRSYDAVFAAYLRMFERFELDVFPVEASSGAFGGAVNHEFMVPTAIGEDQFARCTSLRLRGQPRGGRGGGAAGVGADCRRSTRRAPHPEPSRDRRGRRPLRRPRI